MSYFQIIQIIANNYQIITPWFADAGLRRWRVAVVVQRVDTGTLVDVSNEVQVILSSSELLNGAVLKIYNLLQFKRSRELMAHIPLLTPNYLIVLCDGWVHYLLQKNAAGGPGQTAWRVETAMRDQIVVDDHQQIRG